MEFEVDVSGEDIFNSDYTICLANNNGIIRGFKFNKGLIQVIRSRHGQGSYKYGVSHNQKSLIKVRIYCIIISYLIKDMKNIKEVSLVICRDFDGKENDINSNLKYLLEVVYGIKVSSISHRKLNNDSSAHKYAYLMRKDSKNQLKTYVNISLEEIEKYLKK